MIATITHGPKEYERRQREIVEYAASEGADYFDPDSKRRVGKGALFARRAHARSGWRAALLAVFAG
jgi:hypothetical protein